MGVGMHCRKLVIIAPLLVGLSASAQAAVTISSAPTQNMSCSGGICAPTAATANLNTGDLESDLASGNVEITTTGSGGVQANDIVISSGFNWTSASGLTLDAYRSVQVQASVADNGSGAVSLVTNDGGSGGMLSFISGGTLSFMSTANSLSINGQVYTMLDSLPALAAAIAKKSSGRYALSANYDASQDGIYQHSPIPAKFKGTFIGLGNTISALSIAGTRREEEVGLFSNIASRGTVSSLVLANANISVAADKSKPVSLGGLLAGLNFGAVFNVMAGGQIQARETSSRSTDIGGLVGGNAGSIVASSSAADISVSSKKPSSVDDVGDLVGANTGSISESYSTGSISVSSEVPSDSGGLVGTNDGLIENCYAVGNVTTSASSMADAAGGLVGLTYSAVRDSYSLGEISGGTDDYFGGFIGFDGSNGALSDTYWDTTTSGITNLSQGAGNIANDPGITGETTQQLQSGLPQGFDPAIWAEDPNINNGLPYLIANPPP